MLVRKQTFVVFAFLMGFIFLIPYNHARAVEDEDMAEIKRDLQELKKDLAEIKGLLKGLGTRGQKPVKTTSSTTVDDDPFLGTSSAPITLVEFSDYQCPFCARFYRDTYPVLKKEYISTGKLRYVYRDFPLAFHKQARKAHEAASCAGEQEKYWDMHDSIFDNQKKMEVENLKEYAEALGIDMLLFNKCLDSGKYADEISKDIEAGRKAGVQGTPSFVLGRTQENGEVKGRFIRGAQPTANFRREIDRLLKEVQSEKQATTN